VAHGTIAPACSDGNLTAVARKKAALNVAPASSKAKEGRPLRAGLEALVLSALAARSAEAVVVINAEQSISFYSAAAAKLLRLPLLAKPMTLAEMRLQHPLFDTESASSPLAAALSEHRTAEGELSELPPGGGRRGRFQGLELSFSAAPPLRSTRDVDNHGAVSAVRR
jgi:hypothetical protein